MSKTGEENAARLRTGEENAARLRTREEENSARLKQEKKMLHV
jgi:hypothetical protein